jgi:Cdc6-like AAA superfamily ATPase|tara:strand:- start:2117 stop:3361 length:1245 start_codon:yes stop_codon:yes gene_type:complete
MKFNPFRPNSIAPPDLFHGRDEEMVFIEKSLFQTKNGNPQHFLIEGERGLGKSSLFLKVAEQAVGTTLLINDEKANFIVINVELDSSQSFVDILKTIAADFKRALSEKEKIKTLAADVWNFLSKWEILGVRYHKLDDSLIQPYDILNELVLNFERLLKQAKGHIDGVLVLLDEADRPDEKASLGELVKLLTEKLSKRESNQVVVGMTGQPGLIAKLKTSHESSSRIFTIFALKPLTTTENKAVIQSGLAIANRINKEQTTIDPDAMELISQLSEGYPHFLQEFAFKAFEIDTDNNICSEDVKEAAFGNIGALHQLGHKYFNDLYFTQIGSDDYRRVLQAMSRFSDEWVNRTMIKSEISIKDTILNNALQALKTRNIIIPNPGQQGEFRLPTKSFAAWIKAFYMLDEEPFRNHQS